MKVNSPLEVYKFLPQTNCGDCGEATCMAFASHMIDRSLKLEDCPPLLGDKFKKKYLKLAELLAPEIREVIIGTGEHTVSVGGDDILYRHQLTFFNQPALAVDVWDTMSEDELTERIKYINEYKKFYVGRFLKLDMVAIRSTSGDPDKFKQAVTSVAGNTELPLILCSLDPKVLKAGLEVVADRKPLLYAATKDNWQDVADMVMEYDVPLVLFSPDDLDTLKSLAATFLEMGRDDLILDPGTNPQGKSLRESFENFLMIRRAGIKEGQHEIAFPLLAVPMTAYLANDDPVSASYWETVLASVFSVRYGDIMIVHSIEPYALLPELHIRDTIYTDPRTPVKVDPKVYEVGSPGKDSPVFVTTNFALTYYTVESDLASSGIDCYLLATDTDGLGVEAAVAGGQMTGQKVSDEFKRLGFDFSEMTAHNTVILPGLAARLQGDMEDASGLKVKIGPPDSGRIPGWMEKNWPPE
ncbi:MAG: acetyl-CoA decarbonylase/synthase complex subunit gamma [Methanosarcinales archaeon]|nr:acetyl-CoA decarbonylase/synthase complex subunit gamma [Methanosarcinales archaeon]